jgi:PAS domain S-box-containing protein
MPMQRWRVGFLHDRDKGAARCEDLLAATAAVLWMTDRGGRIVEPQPQWAAYTGQSWDEYRELGWVNAIHEDDRSAVMAQWQRAAASGRFYQAAYRLWNAQSSSHRRVAARAAPVHSAENGIAEWVGTLTDVHDRALSVAELHRVNETLTKQLESQSLEMRRMFDMSLDVLISLDAEGRLLSASPSFETLTGTAPADALGQHCSNYIAAHDVERLRQELARVLAGKPAVDFETTVQGAHAASRIVSWRAAADSAQQRIYAVGRDVTDQKRAAERAIRTERLEAVGQLTGGIAHDFNNVLAGILGHLEVALRIAGAERITRAVSAAINAGRRGTRLVRHLLEFARKQELRAQPVDLNGMLKDLQPLVQHAARSDLRIQLSPRRTFLLSWRIRRSWRWWR